MEFRKMRRSRQELSFADTEQILKVCPTGILGLLGENGYPYTVPLNYVYLDGKIYFHCAQSGHKLDAMQSCEKVSFCVVERDRVSPHAFATNYRSAIAFGRARLVPDAQAQTKRRALEALNQKYAPDFEREGEREILSGWSGVQIVEIQIDHLTGKEALKSVQEKEILLDTQEP